MDNVGVAQWIIDNWNIVLFIGGLILYVGRQKILLDDARTQITSLKSSHGDIHNDLQAFKGQIKELKTELSLSREYQGKSIEKIEALVVRVLDHHYESK